MANVDEHSLHGEQGGLRRRESPGDKDDSFEHGDRSATPPAERVQFIRGEEVGDEARESHPLFAEMEELVKDGDEMEWKETARWIKFEEDVEEGGNRWSKPHVATLSLHSLFELRSLLLNGTVMLDMEASSLEQIADLVLDNLIGRSVLPAESREKVRTTILARHRHQPEHRKLNSALYRSTSRNRECSCGFRALSISKEKRRTTNAYVPANNVVEDKGSASSSARFSKQVSDTKGTYSLVPGQESSGGSGRDRSPSSASISRNHCSSGLENGDANHRGNTNFMRKIPPGAEASNILVGEVDFLDKTLSAFVRLSQAGIMGDLTEVPVPTRFIFVLLGPTGGISGFHEIGRAMATLMSDEVFRDVAYKARNRNHLLAGIDEFLNAVTVLPPGVWDPATRIDPPTVIPSQELRRRPKRGKEIEVAIDEEERADFEQREASGLTRSGKLFGGLVNDVRRKAPWYASDFKDALALQSVASFFYIYFACLSPIITFGGLLSEATDRNMAAMESLVSGCVCGIIYGFFAGQPLTILASTGPVLVLETIVFELCKLVEWNYMSFRFWTGTWMTFTLIVLVAIDASAYVCYITRFTEEIFAALIALVFVYKAIENVLLIGKKFPINVDASVDGMGCRCVPFNVTLLPNATTPSSYETANWTSLDDNDTECDFFNGTIVGAAGCNAPVCMPNIFLMSVILFCGTFLLCVYLKQFRNAPFFPSKVREVVSDFAVIMAIFSMSLLDYHVGMSTPKLEVPQEFKPTLDGRGWYIWPFQQNPWYSALIAVAPALLGTILIFMDQQITAVIVNRKENKLKKGCGYHLDLFVVAILIQICSIMGLPWFVGATVMSISHVQSLKLESECAAPGEKPQFFGVREQRVTQILIFFMIGCSVLLTSILRHIPMPVLFGVFLYMGVASLDGLQFIDRSLITLMPAKYQPDYTYLRKVPVKRVHLFTFIQLLCLASLWVLESFNETSILFPLMLAVLVGVRKLLNLCFTRRELRVLDNIMPKMRRKDVQEMKHLEDGAIGTCG